MNKKQREAKRKNAQAHQKKVHQLAKERTARFNSPEYRERLLERQKINARLFGGDIRVLIHAKPAPLEELVIPFSMAGLFVDMPPVWEGALDKLNLSLSPEDRAKLNVNLMPSAMDTLTEIREALMSDSDMVDSIESSMGARTRHDDVLEGEFEVVQPIKELLKHPTSFGYLEAPTKRIRMIEINKATGQPRFPIKD